MTKIPRGKTETIKKRSLYIYLPSMEMVEDWKQRAEAERRSVSRFVMLKVLESLGGEGKRGERVMKAEYDADIEKVEQEKKELLEENEKLKQENRTLKMLSDNLDNELKTLRVQPFVDAEFVEGRRKFDRALLDLLKNGKTVETDTIMARLHVNPRDSKLVGAVRGQLDTLQALGFVEYDGRWWKWKV